MQKREQLGYQTKGLSQNVMISFFDDRSPVVILLYRNSELLSSIFWKFQNSVFALNFIQIWKYRKIKVQ